jgi:hypothetical protein
VPARPLRSVNLPPLDPLRETRFAAFFDKSGLGDDFDDDDDDPDDELEQDEEDRTNDDN